MSVSDQKRNAREDVPLGAPAFAENKSKDGWPGESALPFVDASYYEQFPLERRPKFEAGGLSGYFNMSVQEFQAITSTYQKPFTMHTFINLGLTEHIVAVPGPSPGSTVTLKIPSFGVVRGDYDTFSKIGMSGRKMPTFGLIPQVGDCGGAQAFTDKSDGRKYTTCKFYNCPRHPQMGMLHSIHYALHFVGSLGDPITDGKSGTVYVPEREIVEKWLHNYNSVDPRPEVSMFVARRLSFLHERTARLAAQAQGRSGNLGR
jgi:hypothetical protein